MESLMNVLLNIHYTAHTELQDKGIVDHSGSQQRMYNTLSARQSCSVTLLLALIYFTCTFCLLWISTSGNGNHEKYLESKHVSVPLWVFKVWSGCLFLRDRLAAVWPRGFQSAALPSLSCSQGRVKGALNRFLCSSWEKNQWRIDWQVYHFFQSDVLPSCFSFYFLPANFISRTFTPAFVLQYLNMQMSLLPT